MNASSFKTMNYEQITMNNANKNKPNQTQPVVSLPAVSKVEPISKAKNAAVFDAEDSQAFAA